MSAFGPTGIRLVLSRCFIRFIGLVGFEGISTVHADFDLIDFIISLDLLVSLISLIFFDLVSVVGLVVLLVLLILVIWFGLVCHVGLLCLVGLIWSSLSSSFSSLVGLVCLFQSLVFVILASLA